jgi:VanZ family protein
MLRFLSAWLPVILWAALILSAANDEFSEAKTRGWLAELLGSAPKIVNIVLRKGGHLFAYGVLALLGWRARRSLFVALFLAIAVAITDETLQSTTLSRGGSPYDVLLDTCGAVLALICVPAVRARLSSRRHAG